MFHETFRGASQERGKYFCCESCHVSGPRLVRISTSLAPNAFYPSREASRNLHGASRMQGKVQYEFTFTGTFTEASRIFTDACFLTQGGKTRDKTWKIILPALHVLPCKGFYSGDHVYISEPIRCSLKSLLFYSVCMSTCSMSSEVKQQRNVCGYGTRS